MLDHRRKPKRAMLFSLLSLAAWQYLPEFATRNLLPIFHQQIYRPLCRRVPPPPNSPQWYRHYRYVYAFVVLGYLCYNFFDAAASMPPNYYEIMGVRPGADENTLKLAFRQFARKYHPDRAGPQGGDAFMEVRDAFEALKNPVTRFAYERFGPEALKWSHCSTLRDFIRHGLMQSAGFYIVTACVLLLVPVLSGPSPVTFWRYLLFAALFTYELTYIMSPSPSSATDSSLASLISNSGSPIPLFSFLWPQRVAYQHIRFLHSLFVFCSVALSRVAPVLFPSDRDDSVQSPRLRAEIQRVNSMAQALDREISSLLQTELHSVHGPQTGTPPTEATFYHMPLCAEPAEPVLSLLTDEIEHLFIETQLMDGGPLKSAADAAVARRRRAEEQKTSRIRQPLQTGTPSPTPSPPPPPSFLRSLLRNATAAREAPGVEEGSSQGYVRGRSLSY